MGWQLEWADGGHRRVMAVSVMLTIGRHPACDIVLDDPYASRRHCVVEPRELDLFVDARGALNQVQYRGKLVDSAGVVDGQDFLVGDTTFRVRRAASAADDRTLRRERSPSGSVILRLSTRELLDPSGLLLTRLSDAECRILATLARRHPDAATHDELALQVWEGRGYDRYLLHRLVQRVRQRVGPGTLTIESVRGSGYRVTSSIQLV